MLNQASMPTAQRARRRNRWGGFVMTPETAAAWASRLYGEELHPLRNCHTICKVILDQVRPYQVNFKLIGEVWPDDAQYMLVTQSAKFNGYRGMDPSEIPQFEEGEREAVARELLATEEVKDYQFVTFLRD